MPRTRQNDVSPFIPGKRRARPAPPPELNVREAEIWREITARLPVDWFAASQPVLKELCRHSRLADTLMRDVERAQAELDAIQEAPEPAAKLLTAARRELRVLLRMHGLQSQRISSLSTRLRLTPQARYAPSVARTAATASSYPEPWTDWGIERSESDPDPESDGQNGRKPKQ